MRTIGPFRRADRSMTGLSLHVLLVQIAAATAAATKAVRSSDGGSCSTDVDCSLLGVCTAGKKCRCDSGWKGVGCGEADLLPLARDNSLGYINSSAASWGGRPVFSDGRWHLFATVRHWPLQVEPRIIIFLKRLKMSTLHTIATVIMSQEIERKCPLILFMNNSAVIRAEAEAPQGPYTHKEVVLPPFHHNPQVRASACVRCDQPLHFMGFFVPSSCPLPTAF